jgi:hypothetical protein
MSIGVYGLTFLFIGMNYAIHLPGLYSYFISIGTDGAYFSEGIQIYQKIFIIFSSRKGYDFWDTISVPMGYSL